MSNDQQRRKLVPYTLALGGGGARGLAHIGVLKALEKNRMLPTMIVGTSMGALVGAMYAQMQNAEAVEKKMREFLLSEFFKRAGLEQFSDTDTENSHSLWDRFAAHLKQRFLLIGSAFGTGQFAQESLIQGVRMLVEDEEIQRLPVRFAAVASDLLTGQEVVCTTGSVVTAVAASCAVLGIIAPIKAGSRLLVDGTVTSTIPVPAARALSRDPIVAVDVRRSVVNGENYEHGYEVFIRASEITRHRLNDIHLQQARLILKPAVASLNWNDFSLVDECMYNGERAVEANLPALTKLLVKSPFRWLPW